MYQYASVYGIIFNISYLRGMAELLDPSRLQTVHNYAAAYKAGKGVTPSYIYRLIRLGKLPSVSIDGTVFVLLPTA